MTKRFTASDFANARFAEHPDGRTARTVKSKTSNRWSLDGVFLYPDDYMSRKGWVPVPSKPTITESDYQELMDSTSVPYGVGFTDGFHRAGGEVIPDPEPSNTDRLEKLLRESGFEFFTSGHRADARELAEWLNSDCVKAPGGDDE